MEWAKNVELVVGALMGVIALAGLVTRWVWSRVTSRVDSGVSGLKVGHKNIEKRLAAVEAGQAQTDRDIRRIETQMGAMETRMSQLASKKDLSDLAITLAKVEATLGATSQMVDSLYRGVVDRAERGDR